MFVKPILGLVVLVYLPYLSLTSGLKDGGLPLPPICCLPTKYQALLFLVSGTVDVADSVTSSRTVDVADSVTSSRTVDVADSVTSSRNVGYGFAFANGTVRSVFDGERQITYIHANTTLYYGMFPMPFKEDLVNIIDYKNVNTSLNQ